jgi:hypothetical protein
VLQRTPRRHVDERHGTPRSGSNCAGYLAMRDRLRPGDRVGPAFVSPLRQCDRGDRGDVTHINGATRASPIGAMKRPSFAIIT